MDERTKSWAAFGNKYLRANNVTSDNEEFVVIGVGSINNNDKIQVVLKLQQGDVNKEFVCNDTNKRIVEEVAPNSPEETIGKIVTFSKVDTQKPNGTPVKGLRIKFKVEPTA
jgi:hypothetical protein